MNVDLDALPGGVLQLTSELRILGASRGMTVIGDWDPEELLGTSLEQLLSVPARILFQTHVYPALLSDGRVEEVFLTVSSKAGPAVPILFNAQRLGGEEDADGRDGAGGDATFVALLVRIRARSKWEQDLLAVTRSLEAEREASRKLEAELAVTARDLEARHANEQRTREFRDAFVGVVSHELRTPITTIFGMSHLLRGRHQDMDPETLEARLDDIETEADRLRRLTEDLLVLSRAEGGRLELSNDPLVIGHVVRAAISSERERSPGHAFELRLGPDLPLVLGEATYVEQVLRNFLSNAVKYSPAGTTIRTFAEAVDEGVAIRVVDEGAGLGEAEPELLWDLFYRSKGAMQQASGAGIGLFVSRALIEGMGGRVWARAAQTPGTAGAEFGFWLPAAPDPGEEG